MKKHLVALALVSACTREPPPPAPPAPAESALAEPAKRDTAFLERYAATYRFRLGQPTSITPGPGARDVFFLRSGPQSFVRDLYVFETASGSERVLLTAASILAGAEEKLSPEERARRERLRLTAKGIADYAVSSDGERILVPLSGRLYVVERDSGAVTELPSDGGYPNDPSFSPDGGKVACVRDGDLYVIDVTRRSQTRLTRTAKPGLVNGMAEFVAQEEMGRYRGYWWSPDGKWIAYQETDLSPVEQLNVADPTQPEKVPEQWSFPRAGKANAKVRLGVMPASGGATRWLPWNAAEYPYLATVRWEEGAPLTFLVQNRRQTEMKLLAVDTPQAAPRELLSERDDAWLNLDQSAPRWTQGGQAFLWSSEREGAWVLELRDAQGALVRALTPPELGYRELVAVDEAAQVAYVTASPEPTETHLYKVKLGASAMPEKVSAGAGVHSAVFARDARLFVHTSQLATGERKVSVRAAEDGKVIGELTSTAEQPPFMPQPLIARVGEAPGFYTALVRPRDFQAGKKYPVILHVYAGPGVQLVVNEPRAYLLDQWIADQGFIVALVDGRGTPGRGRAWERSVRHNLIDKPLADQVAGLQALAAQHPEMDLTRVGIYGWSFGGYASAMAVMQQPEVFHAAVAGAPVTDWHDYDTHYTERYMGLPQENEAGYGASSVLTHAHKLSRPLLLMHGTADDNVYFMHSLKLSDALFRAGKPHRFLPLVNFTHMVPDPLVTTRLYTLIVDFLAESLR